MLLTWFQRIALGAAGAVAAGVGLAILADPVAFYAGYGVTIGDDANLLSELRAPGANLAALGALIAAGAVWRRWAPAAAILGAAVFLAFAAGRGLSMALDGMPSDALLAAALIELVIGALCLLVLAQERRPANGEARHA